MSPLAPNFETFLVAAGRLRYSVEWPDDDGQAIAPAGLLADLGLSEEELATWVKSASLVGVQLSV